MTSGTIHVVHYLNSRCPLTLQWMTKSLLTDLRAAPLCSKESDQFIHCAVDCPFSPYLLCLSMGLCMDIASDVTTTAKATVLLCYQSPQRCLPPISAKTTLHQGCSATSKPALLLTSITCQSEVARLGSPLKRRQSLSPPFILPTSQNKAALAALKFQIFFVKIL